MVLVVPVVAADAPGVVAVLTLALEAALDRF